MPAHNGPAAWLGIPVTAAWPWPGEGAFCVGLAAGAGVGFAAGAGAGLALLAWVGAGATVAGGAGLLLDPPVPPVGGAHTVVTVGGTVAGRARHCGPIITLRSGMGCEEPANSNGRLCRWPAPPCPEDDCALLLGRAWRASAPDCAQACNQAPRPHATTNHAQMANTWFFGMLNPTFGRLGGGTAGDHVSMQRIGDATCASKAPISDASPNKNTWGWLPGSSRQANRPPAPTHRAVRRRPQQIRPPASQRPVCTPGTRIGAISAWATFNAWAPVADAGGIACPAARIAPGSVTAVYCGWPPGPGAASMARKCGPIQRGAHAGLTLAAPTTAALCRAGALDGNRSGPGLQRAANRLDMLFEPEQKKAPSAYQSVFDETSAGQPNNSRAGSYGGFVLGIDQHHVRLMKRADHILAQRWLIPVLPPTEESTATITWWESE
ncbi:hypothetical protein FQR65_LT20310 [Abscondita terminalis]|nr:hypothetical protein FQR65_LT20310 [Abscondita terminalis]